MRLGAEIRAERLLVTEAGGRADAGEWLVSSGRPLSGFELRIVDERGGVLPEGHLGELIVRGPTVVDGYEGGSPEQLTAFADGELHTGDAAFLLDGELHVVGRMGDAISTRGRSVYLEDVEAQLMQVPGIPFGRCVVIGGADQVVALVEAEPGPWVAPARAAVVRHCGSELGVEVRCARRGTILRTTSGKPRRRAMWRQLLDGSLGGIPVG
jgi:acyl-CoA synthetase (AMP-forming)/AMP-acid ligase II